MVKKTKKARKTSKKALKSTRKHGTQRHARNVEGTARKTVSKPSSTPSTKPPQPLAKPAAQQTTRVAIDKIDRETVLGDLIVAFPWTREVLRKYGLQLEAEGAGDIYMSIEAFAAIRNIKPDSLVRELVDASKLPPQPTVLAPLVAPPPT